MKFVFKNDVYSYFAIVAALLLVLCIVELPREYYRVLRFIICLAAVITAIKSSKELFVLFTFILIAYLFNPIVPIYLYRKLIWLPIDVISAILFLLMTFRIKKPNKTTYSHKKRKSQAYGRDRKY